MKTCPGVCLLLLVGCAPARPMQLRQPFPGISSEPGSREVTIEASVCLDAGWLEQIACSPGSRVHESLVAVEARPRDVHAALLLAGFEPGGPGHWSEEKDGQVVLVPPRGDWLAISVRYASRSGGLVEEPIGEWMAGVSGDATFPRDAVWVFAGSAIVPNPPWMEPGEHYVADLTGSIVGLVTFGDEVIGFREVLPDQEDVEPPQWQVRSDHVPPVGTLVSLIIRPAAGERHRERSPRRRPRREGWALPRGRTGT